jgi:hypothetical protein
MLKRNTNPTTKTPRHQEHKVSPRKHDFDLVHLGELGVLVVRSFL